MSYAIIRNANYKRYNLPGLYKHTERKNTNYSNKDIEKNKLVCEFIITSDKEFFETIGEKETKRYFQTAYNFVANYKNLSEKYILSAKVHMNESTPHLHLVFVPVVQKVDKKSGNKIACSEYCKEKNSYQQLQDNFYKYITNNGFNLERGKTKKR